MGQERWAELNKKLEKVAPDNWQQVDDAIAALFATISETPRLILQDFDAFSEDTLTDDARTSRIANGEIAVEVQSSERMTILDAARLLRALEEVKLEVRSPDLGNGAFESFKSDWLTADGGHYVIPRLTRRHAGKGDPFSRRGLLHNRVIPTRVGKFGVRLHRVPRLPTAGTGKDIRHERPRRYGAALFPGLSPILSEDEELFTVEGLEGMDAPRLLDEHLKSARRDECSVIVWGELTMPQESLEALQDRLADDALEGHHPLQYLVAGSWHRDVDGVRNIASILDGNGGLIFEAYKWAKFTFGGRVEDIVPGNEVHVLICEDELMTVAVCRDFLDCNEEVPYLKLNVDVAIVPSMISSTAERTTLKAHAATANAMRVRYETRTLVVAQPATPGGKGSGLILPFSRQPLEEKIITVDGPWHLCILEPP